MGFFDFLFRKKGKNYEKISLEKLEEATKEKIAESEESFKQEATNFFTQAKSHKGKLKESLRKLSEAKITGKVDPQLEKISMTSRKSFTNKIEVLTKEIPEDFTIHSLSQICSNFIMQFKDVDASTVQEFAAIKEVFKSESQNVVDEMKNMKKIFDDFGNKLEKKENEIAPFEEIVNKIKIIKEEKEKMGKFGKDLENISAKSDNLKKENEMLQNNLRKLEDGEEWKKFLEMKRKRSEKENEKTEIISKVVQNFAAIERPIKKLSKILQNTENEVEIDKKLLEKYLSSPFDAFIEDYEKKAIGSILKETAKKIEENKIDEKKSLQKIKEMVDGDVFGNLAREWQKVNSELEDLNSKIENSEADRERNEMLKTLAEREKEIKEGSKEKIEEQIKSLEQDFSQHKDELKQLARERMSAELEF